MNNDDLDSQLSAMYDGELPGHECELVARRLARDPDLRKRWHHYAVIGAVMRAERGVSLDDRLARGVRAAIAAEPEFQPGDAVAVAATGAGDSAAGSAAMSTPATTMPRAPASARWLRPVAAVGIAASVAAVSILWLRAQAPAGLAGAPLVADTAAQPTPAVSLPASDRARGNGVPAPTAYTVPPATPERTVMAPAELANYVVAHSEYSSPLTRRFPLSAIVSSEPAEAPPAASTQVQFVQEAPADAVPSR